MSASTAITVVETVKGTLVKSGVTVSDVFKAVAQSAVSDVLVTPPLPQSPALAPEAEQALKALPGLLASITLPDSRRALTEQEKIELIEVTVEVKAAKAAVTKAETQLKVAAFNHFDAVALDANAVSGQTPRTKEGWFVVDDRDSLAVGGETKKLTREVKSGSVEMTAESLHALEEAGLLDHETYLGLTMPVRVVDEDAVLAALKRDPELATVLAQATTVSAPTASFNLRSNT